MENKYYTPQLEEFYAGFEYEMSDGYSYINEIFPNPWWNGGGMGGFNTLKNCLNNSIVRVKVLDKSDVESLGFQECSSPNKVMYGNGFDCFEMFKEHLHYIIEHYIEDNHVVIYINNSETMKPFDRKQIFNGTIKNKSEFKKLIKSLNIL